jgi:hypothetical protein
MAMTRTPRDFEYDYLGFSYQIEDLLQKKTASYAVQHEIEKTHQQLMELGQKMFSMDDPRDREYDYLAALYKIQDLLQQKTAAYSMGHEIEALHQQMQQAGSKLGWGHAPASGDPELATRLSRLQSQIEDLRSVLN